MIDAHTPALHKRKLSHRRVYAKLTVTLFLVATLIVALSPIVTAQTAMTANQRRLYELELGYFADLACPPGKTVTTTSATALIGADNRAKALNFFIGKGFTKEQAAGAIGNMMRESNLNPYADQPNGKGMGIAQWSEGERWDTIPNGNLLDFATDNNRDPFALDTQLDFIIFEFNSTEKRAYEAFKATTTVDEAVFEFEDKYERSGDAVGSEGMSQRYYYAYEAYKSLGGTAPTNPLAPAPLPGATPAASDICGNYSYGAGVGFTAAASQYIDGIEIFSQTDLRWKNYPYGTSTIGVAGCGVTAMATIITALTGNYTSPDTVTEYANTRNLYVDGRGSSWSMPPIIAEHWNLSATKINPTIADVTAILNQGGMVITSGQGALPFSTTSGHYIAIRAVTPDGKWMVADSSHQGMGTNNTPYAPEFLLSIIVDSGRGGSMYGITK